MMLFGELMVCWIGLDEGLVDVGDEFDEGDFYVDEIVVV